MTIILNPKSEMRNSATFNIFDGVRSLGRKTYTRGIGRALNNTNISGIRVMWMLAFVVCFMLLLVHTTYLFVNYLKFDYTTALKEQKFNNDSDHQVMTNNYVSSLINIGRCTES